MKAKTSTMALALLLLMLTGFAACQRTETATGQQQEEYVAVATNIDLPYWQEARREFEDAAQELGVKARFIGTHVYNPTEQAQIFTSAARTKPAGILVAPADPDVLKGPIDLAVQQGVPVGSFDSDSPASARLFFIGTSNYDAGRQGGELLAKALGGSGKVVLLTVPRQWNLEERVLGYQDALKNYPKIQIVGVLNDTSDPGRASAVVTEILHKHSDLRGIGCLDAAGGPGAVEAVKKAAKTPQVAIVAMDKDQPTLELVRDGMIWATLGQKTYTMSYYGLKMLHDLHHNSVRMFPDWQLVQVCPLPSRIDTGIVLITRDNVQALLQ